MCKMGHDAPSSSGTVSRAGASRNHSEIVEFISGTRLLEYDFCHQDCAAWGVGGFVWCWVLGFFVVFVSLVLVFEGGALFVRLFVL